jgi:hypothetical protein
VQQRELSRSENHQHCIRKVQVCSRLVKWISNWSGRDIPFREMSGVVELIILVGREEQIQVFVRSDRTAPS